MLTISICNAKGGVGKTSITANLAFELQRRDQKVVMLDLDRQADLSKIYLPENYSGPTILDLLKRKHLPQNVLLPITENLSLIPGSQDIGTFGFRSNKQILQRYLKELEEYADIVLIDHPPALNSVTAAALGASDEVLIVSDCEPFSMQNLECLLRDLGDIKQTMNKNLHILGILVNRVDKRRTLAKKMLADCRRAFGNDVFDAHISNDTAIPISIYRKVPLRQLNWHSRTVTQLNNVIDEISERLV